ncbi:acyltransferase family protein [Glycomyces terrestris]|uniref:Acyltransferase n=1 Tax=Glycomyces terrestris TaxID=2493553 RepID=A0A426USI5_9ACTN|nr:acyltransferase family protein [Glycomyces terrestris]RRR96453.1 acyltransferase [Glycomyces terrestris]
MTSPQPPRPQPRAAAGGGVNEETLHLPASTPGAAAPPAAATQRTAPSPYPVRPPFRAPAPPPPGPQAPPGPMRTTGAHPRPAPAPLAAPLRWEGVGFRPDIQGLRAVAVALVLLSHVGFSFAAGGYVGVDVFFVVSGFLITSLLVKEVFDTGRISLAGFYARRARRILPAASAVTIATALGAWLWFPVTRLEAVMQDAFTVIVYAVNYRFVATETEYLNADQMPSPFQQYWSLAVEEQFYVVWPLLLIGLLALAKRSPRKLLSAAIASCAGIFALSLVLSVLTTEVSQPTAYYAAHTRIWELAAGALLALMLPTLKRIPAAAAWILGLGGLAAIVAAGVLYDASTPFPGYTALLPVLGTAAVIAAGSGAKNPASALLATGPFQYVGKISYSLYLWHWPILILIPLAVDAEPTVGLHTVLLLATVAVAQLSYLYIEEPVRRARPLRTSNMWGLVTGVACSLLGIAMVLTLTLGFGKVPPQEEPVDLEAVEEVEDVSEIELRLQEGLAVTTVPADLEPSLTSVASDEPEIYGDGCHLDAWTESLLDGCAFGAPDSGTTVMLFGDSHAAQWFPALEPIAVEQGWRLVTRTKSACTPASTTVSNETVGGEYTSCSDWRENVLAEIEEVRPAMVILSGEDAPPIVEWEDDGPEAWAQAWTDTLARVTAAAANTVVLTDTPRSPTGDPIPECVALHQDSVAECVMQRSEAIDDSGNREAAMAAQQEAGATVVETVGWFCYAGACPVVTGNLLVYRDSHHMSTPYARSLTQLLRDELPAL